MKRVGLIVNPIAGMGGSVGLKGTDGCVEEALRRGAVPHAQERARAALEELTDLKDPVCIVTFPGAMGGDVAAALGFSTELLLPSRPGGETTEADTEELAGRLVELGADLLLFAGGDGTARAVYRAAGLSIPALGIPAGVKIHSPVYAKTPRAAGLLARRFLCGAVHSVSSEEVLDIDEELYRRELVTTRLYGYLSVPRDRTLTQSRKSPTPLGETASIESIAHQVLRDMEPGVCYLVGAGTTTRGVMQLLGLSNTLIGVDAVCDRALVGSDLYGKNLLDAVAGRPAKLLVTVTGGQGFLFGRGNQQLTPEILRYVGRENIVILATREKLFSLRGNSLLVDTGDPTLDQALSGYYRVICGYGESVVCRVET